jgi:ATP-dependent RNA helicase DDX19/DBP5
MAASNETKVPSLEDRITMPDTKEVTSSAAKDEITKPTSSEGMNVTAPSFVPGQLGSWADEANSPLDANPPAADPAKGKEPDDDLAKAQTDGAGEAFNGTPGIYEPTRYSVDVKLNDMQADPNNPLYSVKSFEDLNL